MAEKSVDIRLRFIESEGCRMNNGMRHRQWADANLHKCAWLSDDKNRYNSPSKSCILLSGSCDFETTCIVLSLRVDMTTAILTEECLRRRGAVKIAPNSLFLLNRKICFNVCCTTFLITVGRIVVWVTKIRHTCCEVDVKWCKKLELHAVP